MTSHDYDVWHVSSTDGGSTWSSANVVQPSNGYRQTDPQLKTDSSNNIYIVWQGQDISSPTKYEIKYSKSTDGGSTWSAVSNIASDPSSDDSAPSILVDNNDNLFVFFPRSNSCIVCKSTDSGSSWNVSSFDAGSNSGLTSIDNIPPYSAVVDTSNNIHICWSNGLQDINYKSSTDGGSTWSATEEIYDGSAYDGFICKLAIDSYDDLHLVFYGEDSENTSLEQIKYLNYTEPYITTDAVTNLKSTTVTFNGTATAKFTTSERGFTYSTTTTPTIYTGTKVPSSSGSGSFDEDITGLLPNTTYYVRAYARYYDESGVLQTEYGDNVEFTTATLYGRLKYHNGTEWVLYPRPLLGTTNQITVTDNLNTTYTLSTPQDIHTGATPTFVSALLSGLTASRLVATDGTKTLESIADLTAWIAGTDGNLTVTDDGDGTVTLKSIGSIVNVTTLTDTDTLTVAQQGTIKCNKASAMTVNLPTAVGNTGLSYFISNVNAGTATLDPDGAETIQGDPTFDLYQDESLSIVSDGANWIVR